jgi:hypothetical protein
VIITKLSSSVLYIYFLHFHSSFFVFFRLNITGSNTKSCAKAKFRGLRVSATLRIFAKMEKWLIFVSTSGAGHDGYVSGQPAPRREGHGGHTLPGEAHRQVPSSHNKSGLFSLCLTVLHNQRKEAPLRIPLFTLTRIRIRNTSYGFLLYRSNEKLIFGVYLCSVSNSPSPAAQPGPTQMRITLADKPGAGGASPASSAKKQVERFTV